MHLSGAAKKPAAHKDAKQIHPEAMDMDGFKKWRESNAMPIAHIKGFESGISGGDLWTKYAKQRLIQFNVIAFEASAFQKEGFTEVVAGFLNHRKSNFAIAFTPASKVDAFFEGWVVDGMQQFPGRLMCCGFDMDAEKKRFELAKEDNRVSSLSADEKEAYFTGRVAMKAANSKTCISLGGDAVAALEAELSTQKEGCAWAIYALSRGKSETKATLLDWAYENKDAVNVEFVREVGDNDAKGFFKPPPPTVNKATVPASTSDSTCGDDTVAWVLMASCVAVGVVVGIAVMKRLR